MVYTIIGYESEPVEMWTLKSTKLPYDTIKVDLVVGGELEDEVLKAMGGINKNSIHNYNVWCKSLIGRKVEVKELQPVVAIGVGVKLM